MTREEIFELVTNQMPEIQQGVNTQFPEMIIGAENIHLLSRFLKLAPQLRMDYLICLTAADRKDGLHVIYHLSSTENKHTIMMRVILQDKENPVVPSVADIWHSAEFFEREVFDLFGIHFQNHPDLRRIFLTDDWEGYPLRKDYKDPYILAH